MLPLKPTATATATATETTLYTLHSLCQDRDGPRGEERIRALLRCAERAWGPTPPVSLSPSTGDRGGGGYFESCDEGNGDSVGNGGGAVEWTIPSSSSIHRRPGGDTPLHFLIANDSATPGSVGEVCSAFPSSPYSGRDYGLTPLSDACYGCRVGSGRGLVDRVRAMLVVADTSPRCRAEYGGVDGLVTGRDRIKGETPLHGLVQSLRWAAEQPDRETRDGLLRLLLGSCPRALTVPDNHGNAPLHSAVHFGSRFFPRDESYTLDLVRALSKAVPIQYLIVALSITNTSPPVYRPSPEYPTTNKGAGGRAGGPQMTPLCLLHEKGMAEVEGFFAKMAREDRGGGSGGSDDKTDERGGWTMLHHAAVTTSLPTSDDDCKSGGQGRSLNAGQEFKKRRLSQRGATADDADRRPVQGGRVDPREKDHEGGLGRRKLIDWLLTVAPETSWVRDVSGRLPLHIAVEGGRTWGGGGREPREGLSRFRGMHQSNYRSVSVYVRGSDDWGPR